MPTIDCPLIHDTAIELGTFVVVAVDPVASVALLDDEQVAREATAMRPAKYLALIKRHVDFEWDEERGAQKLTLQFALAGHGPANATNSWASMPIYPAPAAGGSSWGPITPSPPIPWDDCYMHNLHSVSGIVSRIHQASAVGPRLSTEDQDHVLTCAFEDQRRLGKANRARLAKERASNPVPRPERRTYPPAGSNDVSHDLSKDATVFDIIQYDDMPRLKLHFEVWTDLTQFTRVDNPGGIKAEIDNLKRIEREWAQRTASEMLSKEPQTSAWLQGISDADAPLVGPGDDIMPESLSDNDDLVIPEDAIEHRIERENISPYTPNFPEELDPETLPSADGVKHTGSTWHTVPSGDHGGSTREMAISVHDDFDTAPEAVSQSPSANGKRGEDPIPCAGHGGFAVFRLVLSHIGSYISRFRSFFWGLLWRKPFAKR